MKTSLLTIAIIATFVSVHAAELPKIDWEAMSADEIKAKVISLESFKDVTTLLGKPRSISNCALTSSAKYNIGRNFVLFFCGTPENHFSKKDDLRKVRSVYFYRRIPDNQIQLVWKVFKHQDPEREIRSDHIDFPLPNPMQKPAHPTAGSV